jgi:hypothetical protein
MSVLHYLLPGGGGWIFFYCLIFGERGVFFLPSAFYGRLLGVVPLHLQKAEV